VEYEWDADNTAHIWEPGVRPYQAQESLEEPRRVASEPYWRHGEQRIFSIGRIRRQRLLSVVYTLRPDGRIRVATAWWSNADERTRYREVNQ
jgi:uncharacterized DUF497 family protein